MSHFQSLRVNQIQRLNPNAVVISFDNTQANFHWEAGQYITLRTDIHGESVRRSYSICSAPHEGILQVGVKKIEGGKMSSFLNDTLTEGSELEVMPPEGNFTLPDLAAEYVFFAAGSGITPILSQIKTLVQAGLGSKVKLFFANRSEGEAMFLESLREMKQTGALHLTEIFSDGSTGVPSTSGRLDFGKVTEILSQQLPQAQEAHYFICGPTGMMQSVQNALQDHGVAKGNLHLEYFTPPENASTTATEVEAPSAVDDFSGTATIKILLDDEDSELQLASDGDVILDAALDEGLDAPYSCKGGVCTSCRAKLLEGKVHMDNNFALTDEEKAEGFILTCQSHPRSAVVHISYDE